jgi:hypothetical protein
MVRLQTGISFFKDVETTKGEEIKGTANCHLNFKHTLFACFSTQI